MGVRVPEEVAVVGMNNSRYAQLSNPALTSIDNMLYDTSLIAVRNLLEVLKGERVNHKMSIGSEVVERASTRWPQLYLFVLLRYQCSSS